MQGNDPTLALDQRLHDVESQAIALSACLPRRTLPARIERAHRIRLTHSGPVVTHRQPYQLTRALRTDANSASCR